MPVPDRIIRGLKATLVARVCKMIVNGLLLLLLARVLLTPTEYGLLFLAISIVGVAKMFGDLGLSRSAAYYVTKFKEAEPAKVPSVLRISIQYRLLLLCIVGSVLVLGSGLIASILDEPELAPILVIGAGYLVTLSLHSFVGTIFQGFNRVSLTAVIDIVHNISRLLFVIGFLVLGFGVAGAMSGYLIGALISATIGFVILYVGFYSKYRGAEPTKTLRNRILRYSVPLTATQAANVVDKRVDTILIGFFLNPVAVGYYVLSKQITEFVLVPAGSLGFSVSPTYGEQKAEGALEQGARIYETTLRYVMLLYVPGAVGLFLVAEPAVQLVFGSDYLGAVPVLQIFGLYVVFHAITNVTTQSLDYLGRAKDRAIAKGVTSIANLLLNVLLIPLYGVVGAAFATVLTYGVYTTVNLYIMQVELPLDSRSVMRSIVPICGISLCMGAVVFWIRPYVSDLPTLILTILSGVVVWAVLAITSGLLNPHEAVARLKSSSG